MSSAKLAGLDRR